MEIQYPLPAHSNPENKYLVNLSSQPNGCTTFLTVRFLKHVNLHTNKHNCVVNPLLPEKNATLTVTCGV